MERSMEGDDDLGAGAVNLAASDLDDLADGNRLIAADIEHSLEDEVCGCARGSKRGGVACLEGQREQSTGVERAIVVCIARQNKPVRKGFGVRLVRIGHERPADCLSLQ